jgi:HSP20 family protein
MNVYERGHRFLILAELPGVDPGAIEVSVAGDTLTIRGERRRDDRVPDDQYRRQERPFGSWERSVTLPEAVLANEVSADIENGVLRIELPKAVRPRPQQIPVTARSGKASPAASRHRALEPPQSQAATQLPRPALPSVDISKGSAPASSDEGEL